MSSEKILSSFLSKKDLREQNKILDEAEKWEPNAEREFLSEILNNNVNPFIRERVSGRITTLDKKRLQAAILKGSGKSSQTPDAIQSIPTLDTQINPPSFLSNTDEITEINPNEFTFYSHYLNKSERNLIERIIKKIKSDFCGVSIKQMPGGFSGAKVYLVRALIKKSDGILNVRPKAFIVKIGAVEKIESEYNRANDASTRSTSHKPDFEKIEDMGCLLQEVASNSFDGSTISLGELIWPTANVGSKKGYQSIENLKNTLKGIHGQILAWHKEASLREDTVTSSMSLPLNQIKDERLRLRLSNAGIPLGEKKITKNLLGFELINPYFYLREIEKRNPRIKYFKQPLHGDMHVGNIQIDMTNVAHFIDWGNSESGHSGLDYAMLEASIWGKCLPADFSINQIFSKLEHLYYPGTGSLTTHEIIFVDEINNPLERCSSMALIARHFASDILPDPKEQSYALALFYCTVQMMQYEDTNLAGLLALSQSSITKLEEDWGYV